MLSLRLLGGCTLHNDGASMPGPVSQRRRLALLALVGCSGSRGLSRDKLTAFFWPEEDRDRARHFLADSLFTIRKTVGKDVFLSTGSEISVNREVVYIDAAEFEATAERGEFESAISLYGGPFLDGFFISNSPDFDRWADHERERLSALYSTCLEHVAQEKENRGDHATAAIWWRRLASENPYSARITLRTMHSLDRAGDSASAIRSAAKFQQLVRDDLDLAPDPEVAAFAEKLRLNPIRIDARSVTESAPPSVTRVTPAGALDQEVASRIVESPKPATHESRKLRQQWSYALAGSILVFAAVAGFAISNYMPVRKRAPNRSLELSGPPSAHYEKPPPSVRHEAEDLYSQARYLMQATHRSGRYTEALALYHKAVERDSTFAKAYAGMADVYNYMEDPRRAKESALKALSLDSTMAEAFNAIAYVYAYYEHRWLAADSAVARATKMSPRFTLAHLRRANINAVLGRADTAYSSLEKARAIEPESWTVLYNRGAVALALGLIGEAIAHFEAALALEPDRKDLQEQLAWNYWASGRKEEAIALMRSLGATTDAAILSADKPELRALIRRFETDTSALTPCQAVMIYYELGDKEAAFRHLRREAIRNRFLPMELRSPPYVWLKDDARYREMMSELGLR